MQYLTQSADIRSQIAEFSSARVLWLDTEVADWHTPRPRLSLIQVLADARDTKGSSVYLLDVLDQPDLIAEFISQVMVNPEIEKVFHNASYDLRYLGHPQAQNVTCTLKLARKLGANALGVSNLKLKTLAVELCQFSDVDTEEQASNWGRRSLTPKQLQYATMDVVYLAAVHRCLLEVASPVTSQCEVNMTLNGSQANKSQPAQSGSLRLSATKVRLAFECPRLFYLNHQFQDRAQFLPPDATLGVGNPFHDLADAFLQLAVHEPRFQDFFQADPENLNPEQVAAQMQQLFYELKFFDYLTATTQKSPSSAPVLLKVWQGLQGLIRYLAGILIENRSFCSAESVIHSTFILGDRRVSHEFPLPNGTQQRVVGEFDCLIYRFAPHRLCVVEFKTYQPVDPSAQLAQVALYSYMLWIKKQVPVDSAVYCVLPQFKDYQYPWEQLKDTVHQLIPHKLQQMREWLTWQPPQPDPPAATLQPHLCQSCSQRTKCQTFFIKTASSQPTSQTGQQKTAHIPVQPKPKIPAKPQPKQDPVPTVNTDVMGQELVKILNSFKIETTYRGAAIGPAFVRVKLKPELGVKVNSILKLSDDLRVQLGLTYPPLIAPQAGFISVDLPRPDRQTAHFEHYIQSKTLDPTESVRIAIGVNLDGNLVEADLSDPNTCHFLVGGTTGSGKSEFLRSLLLSLIVRHEPSHLKVALVDPKRVTFPEFEQMPWLFSPIVKDSDRAIDLMGKLVDEMESRYQRFEATGCNDLRTYNQQMSQQSSKLLPRIVCIFDEYADFMAEKEPRTALEQSIKRLGAMARAAGIHLIIATQRPEAKVVTPLIRSNLPGRVALRTASEADSAIVLGGNQKSAAALLGKGDLLYLAGADFQRLQSLFASKIHLSR